MILLTGANGLIGSYIARVLAQNGKQFKCLVRQGADLSLLSDIQSKLNIVQGDILDILSLEKALEGVEVIIHCAAIVSFGQGLVDQMYKVNVEGTKNVVNEALKYNIKKLVYISSVAAIGRGNKNSLITEKSQWVDNELNSEYAKTKYLAELEVWRGIEEGLNAVMVNPSIVLGPGDWTKSSTKIFKTVYDGLKFYPTGKVNVVDVRDVARAVYLLMESEIKGQRFILSAYNLSYKSFLDKIAEAMQKPLPSIRLSKNLTLAGFYILKIIAPIYLKSRFINKETILASNSDFNYSSEKIIKALNFQFTPLDETINWASNELLKKQG